MPFLRNLFLAHFAAAITFRRASAFAPPRPSSSRGRIGPSPSSPPPRPPASSSSSSFRSSPCPRRTSFATDDLILLCESSRPDDVAEGGGSSVDGDGDGGSPPSSCWNPDLRKRLVAVSSLGLLETAYLTYDKVRYSSSGGKLSSSLVGALCSATSAGGGGASSCGDVLHGPYASLHLGGGTDVPLSALGAAAYATVLLLAALPLVNPDKKNDDDDGERERGAVTDGNNRIALLGGTTLMASFSVYLVSLLVGVLHASCLFCLASAGLSVSLAAMSWLGGTLPNADEGSHSSSGEEGRMPSEEALELRMRGLTAGASSVGLATFAALGLFLGVGDGGGDGNFNELMAASSSSAEAGGSGGTLLASTDRGIKSYRENVPPSITTTSSPAALALAADLKSLDSRMFGAFWCSHCYDQKQALGYEAMQTVPYVECDREGYNNRRELCKERELPGYPTWEIGGKLFPGERSLDELREIVDDVKAGR